MWPTAWKEVLSSYRDPVLSATNVNPRTAGMNDLPWLFFGLARHGRCPHAGKWGAWGNTAAKDSISPARSWLTPGRQRLHVDTERATLFWRVQTHQYLNGLGSPRPPYLAMCLLRAARHLPGGSFETTPGVQQSESSDRFFGPVVELAYRPFQAASHSARGIGGPG